MRQEEVLLNFAMKIEEQSCAVFLYRVGKAVNKVYFRTCPLDLPPLFYK
jgi:hypothetical protein